MARIELMDSKPNMYPSFVDYKNALNVVYHDDLGSIPRDRMAVSSDARTRLLVRNDKANLNASWIRPDKYATIPVETVEFTQLPDTPENKQLRPYTAVFRFMFRKPARTLEMLQPNEFRIRISPSVPEFRRIDGWSLATVPFKVIALARSTKRVRE